MPKANKLLQTSAQYVIAISIELLRRSLAEDPEQIKRNLELSAYFTKPNLEPRHRQIALQVAMQLAFKNKNFLSASNFAGRALANGTTGKATENVRN